MLGHTGIHKDTHTARTKLQPKRVKERNDYVELRKRVVFFLVLVSKDMWKGSITCTKTDVVWV
jgi:hypothetical protein